MLESRQPNTAYSIERANVPTDPHATPDAAPDPTEDTPADGDQDTAPDTQGSTDDWEHRYKQLQGRASRAERERDLLRQQLEAASDEDVDDEEADEDDAPEEPEQRAQGADRLARDSWALAEQVYGESAIEAYSAAYRLLDRAVTPADHVAAFEAYHERRLKGASPAAAAAPAQGGQPAQPRIESNRPDAGPDLTDIDRRAEAARASGDSRGWLQTQLEKVGIR
jgi:hypothetical protein